MSRRLEGQTAWISGAASGIGEATARLFAEEGANVALVDVQVDRGRRRVPGHRRARRQSSVRRRRRRVAKPTSSRSIDETVRQFGGLNILVNCAGIVHVRPLARIRRGGLGPLMGVNVKCIFFSVKHALSAPATPAAKLRGQRRVDQQLRRPGSATPAYTASKEAVLGLSHSIALDYAATGLRCNCVCPGITDTPMLREHLNKTPDPEATLANRLRRVPMGVALTPEDVARAVLYLSAARIPRASPGRRWSSTAAISPPRSGMVVEHRASPRNLIPG